MIFINDLNIPIEDIRELTKASNDMIIKKLTDFDVFVERMKQIKKEFDEAIHYVETH